MAGSLPEMPCGPILELNGQRKRFHVPFGLKPLMDEIIRKVLRDQPEDIYEYLARFMEARVQKNELKEGKARKRSDGLGEEFLNEFLQSLRTSLEIADHCATVIQTAYRGHVARQFVKELRNSMCLAKPDTEEKEHGDGKCVRKSDLEKLENEENIDEEYEEENEEESELDETEYYENDEENDNFAGDEDEDYSKTFGDKDSEEEFETEAETISEMEDLAEEMEVLTVKPAGSHSKYQLEQSPSKDEQADQGEE